ncbi:uncharacterized protein DUF397 [Haloactinospora alba]|uniref:Uncharacterized protein DUF397 n=1 Tax=Haloactinospora alba TaxID=405555 RepID=A0A543NK93_9ACTN|nr:DUF397 domain-containing protein [Haloactinospora alba]TQN32226.1 uncharacterized protein DUF397 [Haloactinospora alba]
MTLLPHKEDAVWRKSSYSGEGANCVEAAATAGSAGQTDFLLRDSQHPHVSWLACSRVEWHAFVTGIKRGAFDR